MISINGNRLLVKCFSCKPDNFSTEKKKTKNTYLTKNLIDHIKYCNSGDNQPTFTTSVKHTHTHKYTLATQLNKCKLTKEINTFDKPMNPKRRENKNPLLQKPTTV